MYLMKIRVVEPELCFLLCIWRCRLVERMDNGSICVFANIAVFLLILINCRAGVLF